MHEPTARYKPEDQDCAAVVVTPCFDVCICEEEDGENDGDNVPAREDEPKGPLYSVICVITHPTIKRT